MLWPDAFCHLFPLNNCWMKMNSDNLREKCVKIFHEKR